jgi:hypothetical protein
MTLLQVLNPPEKQEALCIRCGVSCHLPIEVGDDKLVVEEICCRFLVREAKGRFACAVYENRFEAAPWCHTAAEAATTGNLAFDCQYAAHIPGYKGKRWATPEQRKKLMPIVRKKLITEGLPLSASPEWALKALNRGGETWTYAQETNHFVFHRKG